MKNAFRQVLALAEGAEGAHQLPGGGNFLGGGFGERDPHGVAQTVAEQGADADGGLDASLGAVARLRDAQVQRVVHPFGVHGHRQQPVGPDRHQRVGGLHGDHVLVEAVAGQDAQVFHGAFHHPPRRVPMTVEHAVRQRPVVDPHPQRTAVTLQCLDQRQQRILHPRQFPGVLGVGIVAHLEALPVHVIARVDAHLFHMGRRAHRQPGVEMDIGHQGHGQALFRHCRPDLRQGLQVAAGGHGEPHDLTARPGQFPHLLDHPGHVPGIGGEHGLDADRLVPPDAHIAHHHHPGGAAAVGQRGRKIFREAGFAAGGCGFHQLRCHK